MGKRQMSRRENAEREATLTLKMWLGFMEVIFELCIHTRISFHNFWGNVQGQLRSSMAIHYHQGQLRSTMAIHYNQGQLRS